MALSNRVHYNATEDIIDTDVSGLVLTPDVVDSFAAQLIAAAEKLDHKTYGLVNWENTKIPPEHVDYYGAASAKAAGYYLAIVRYGIGDILANTAVRSQVVRRGVQGSRSYIYATREEALEAIRKMKAMQPQENTKLNNIKATSYLTTPSTPLSLTVFYDNAAVSVYWNDKIRSVQIQWKGFVQDEDYRNGLNKGLELLQNKGTTLLLSDTTKLGVLSQTAQEWTNNHWFPYALKLGLRKMAIILPEKTIPKMTINRIMEKLDNPELETAYFKELEEAYAWLQTS